MVRWKGVDIDLHFYCVLFEEFVYFCVKYEGREKEGEKTNTVALVLWEIVKYTKENVLVNNKE